MNDTPQVANIVNIFRLDESIDLDGFRIIDDIGNDISEVSLIIMNRDFYAFVGNAWRKIG